MIDTYIEDHFAAALVYKVSAFLSIEASYVSVFTQGLMSCVRHCADMVPKAERQDPIRKCFQSLHHVFRFIVTSRQLFSRAMGGQSEDTGGSQPQPRVRMSESSIIFRPEEGGQF